VNRLQIRRAVHRGKNGFLVTGLSTHHHVRIFAETRPVAEHLRDKLKQGAEIVPSDFEPRARWCGTCKQDVPLSDFSSDKMKWCRACNREMVKRKYWKRQLLANGPSAVQTEITSLAKRIAWLQNLLDSQTGT
jgi:hypothetical protein